MWLSIEILLKLYFHLTHFGLKPWLLHASFILPVFAGMIAGSKLAKHSDGIVPDSRAAF